MKQIKTRALCAIIAAAAVCTQLASAQKVYVLPSPTDANSEMTLFIDMNQSEDGIQNNGLSGILDAHPDTTLYLWTWDPAGPAAGNGDWDNSADHQQLTKVGPKLYSMTFIPTEYYGVDGPQLFARGISCLAKLKNGGEAEGFPFEAKSEDLHVDIIPNYAMHVSVSFQNSGSQMIMFLNSFIARNRIRLKASKQERRPWVAHFCERRPTDSPQQCQK